MSTALIVNAIRNMFGRKPKPAPRPRRPIDGLLGQQTRIVLSRYAAQPHMPELPPFQFWNVASYSRGGFCVELHEHTTAGPRLRTRLISPMSELSPETIVDMAQTIKRATGGTA